MRYMSVDEAISKIENGEEIKLGRDITTIARTTLVKGDTVLSPNILMRLKDKEINHLYVNDRLTKDIDIDPVISEEIRRNTISALKDLNIVLVERNAAEIVKCLLATSDLDPDIYSMSEDNQIFSHSIAVSELAVNMIKNIPNYNNRESVLDITLACLLHDIGKLCQDRVNMDKFCVPQDKRPYREDLHPFYGYCLFENSKTFKSTIKQAIRGHHENIDGSGPLGLHNNSIYIFAKIIYICDTFEHIISGTHEECTTPTILEAIEYLRAYSGIKFDKTLVDIFVTRTPFFPKGSTVILSTGQKAVVARNNLVNPLRPQVILDQKDPVVIDLMNSSYDVTISGLESSSTKKGPIR